MDVLRLLRLAAVMPAIDVELESQCIRGVPVENRARGELVLPAIRVFPCLAVLPAVCARSRGERESAKQRVAQRAADEAVDLAGVVPTVAEIGAGGELR